MPRTFLLTLVSFACTLPLALAVPSRPRYDPPAPPTPPPSFLDLSGTRWYGKSYEKEDLTLVFEPTGRISWSHGVNTYTTGSWSQRGNSVYIEMNSKYCEFKGTVSPDIIQGGWWNVIGLRWSNPLYRQPLPKE